MPIIMTPITAGPLPLRFEVKVNGVLTDADPGTVVFRDPTGSYGAYRTDNNDVVIQTGTSWVKTAGQTGKYHYPFEKPPTLGLWFVYWVEYQIDGVTYRERFTQPSEDGLSVPVPPSPEIASAYIIARSPNGQRQPDAKIELRLTDPGAYAGTYASDPFTITANSEGLATAPLIKGATYQGRRGGSRWITFVVPDSETYALPTMIGEDSGCE